MCKLLRFSVLLVVLGAWATSTLAATPSFAQIDTDMDGRLSKEEAAQVEEFDFDAADQDQNGMLNLQEYVTATTQAAVENE